MVGDFTVDKEWHAAVLHRLQHRIDMLHIGYTVSSACGSMSRIEFGRCKHTFLTSAPHHIGVHMIHQITGD